jgi:hypothetical protein
MMTNESTLYFVVANHDREEKAVEAVVSQDLAKGTVEAERAKGRKIEISFYEAASMEAAIKKADEKYPHYHNLALKDVLKTLESDPK